MNYLISLSKFSDVLPAFTCTRAIGNLWKIYFGVNISRLEWSKMVCAFNFFIGNILLWKALRTLSLPLKRLCKFLRTSSFCCFFSLFFGFTCFLKFKISANKSFWSVSASFIIIVLLKISPLKVLIIRKLWKLYVHVFVL